MYKGFSQPKKKQVKRGFSISVVNMVATCPVHRDDDPLLFLKKSSSGSGSGLNLTVDQQLQGGRDKLPVV
jgi:hypothetical protein